MEYNLSRINSIKDILIRKKRTLAVAESVTSGHLQAAFSLADNASEFYQGGITAYNAGQKCRHLNVEPIHAMKANCVSETVCTQMALQAAKLFLSDFGIGVTGYATKAPEIGINKLFAYVSITQGDKVLLTRKLLPTIEADGYATQINYTLQIVDVFLKILKEKM
jgi:PncC family amidohydrolase